MRRFRLRKLAAKWGSNSKRTWKIKCAYDSSNTLAISCQKLLKSVDVRWRYSLQYQCRFLRHSRSGVVGDQSLHCENTDFGLFRLLWPLSWPDDLHILTWPITWSYMYAGFADIWTLYVNAFESYRLTYIHIIQTDRQTDRLDRNYKACRVADAQ